MKTNELEDKCTGEEYVELVTDSHDLRWLIEYFNGPADSEQYLGSAIVRIDEDGTPVEAYFNELLVPAVDEEFEPLSYWECDDDMANYSSLNGLI